MGIDPLREEVKWHGDSWARLSKYQFNTKQKDQLFCGKCGASIGIDFREFNAPRPSRFGISVSRLSISFFVFYCPSLSWFVPCLVS